jgi:hypothetical protein
MKTLDKIEDFLDEAIPVKYYQGLYKPQWIGKKIEPMFLDHRDDIDDRVKKTIQSEKKNYFKAMEKHEKEVLDALSKMDNQAAFWKKYLKKQGL